MKHQIITAPDGSELVVVPRADYDRLVEDAEDRFDIALADSISAESDGFTVPDAVLALMLDRMSAVAAWAKHRGLSQNELARRSGLSQPGVKRVMDGAKPRAATARALAAALEVPLWALDPA